MVVVSWIPSFYTRRPQGPAHEGDPLHPPPIYFLKLEYQRNFGLIEDFGSKKNGVFCSWTWTWESRDFGSPFYSKYSTGAMGFLCCLIDYGRKRRTEPQRAPPRHETELSMFSTFMTRCRDDAHRHFSHPLSSFDLFRSTKISAGAFPP